MEPTAPASVPTTSSADAAGINWAHAVWRHTLADSHAALPALIGLDEQGRKRTLDWPELRQRTASLALALQGMGLQPGDVVALYLPHVPEALVAALACASIGAVCSHGHPLLDIGQALDRWRGLQPKVLLGADGLYWGGQPHDRAHTLHELRTSLPSVEQLVVWRTPYAAERVYGATNLDTLCARDNAATQTFAPVAVPAGHPLWLEHLPVVTGQAPQAVAHSHQSTLAAQRALCQAMRLAASHTPHAPGALPERLYWAASPLCSLWPLAPGCLAQGTTLVLYDGHPCGDVDEPDPERLWRQLVRQHATVCVVDGDAPPGPPPAAWAPQLAHMRYWPWPAQQFGASF